METRKPIITIGITAFNEKEFLLNAWQSVLNQTTEDWNAVLILDGGGDRKTRQIFESIQDPRLIKYFYAKNQGPYPCRNKAIELTITDWYFHLDADDMLPSNSVELILDILQNNLNIEYIGCACKHFSSGDEQIRYPKTDPNQLTISPLFVGAAPISIKLFNLIGGYLVEDHFVHSDWDFWLSVHEKKIKGFITNQVLYERRRRNNSVTWQNLSELELGLEIIIERHPDFFNSIDRIKIARFNLYQNLARQFRTQGKRINAAQYARKALKNGANLPIINTILHEEKMSYLRYLLRRIGRNIK